MKTICRNMYIFPLALAALAIPSFAQQEGPTPTQALVSIDAKSPVTPTTAHITAKVDNQRVQLSNITPVAPNRVQIALLIDDGLRQSVGRELGSLRDFIQSLPAGTEIFVGYMENGGVRAAQNFTADHAAAAQTLRIPSGLPGSSASPYLCLSDFVKQWQKSEFATQGPAQEHKARFILMITNGVDPYNGSTSLMNQNSPYVETATTDAQRIGVPIYSIYFSDSGYRGLRSNFSGQSYLAQIAEGTGGQSFYQGTGNPVSLAPFLKDFQKAVGESYIATFNAPGERKLVHLKLTTDLPGTKVYAPDEVRPGTMIVGSANGYAMR